MFCVISSSLNVFEYTKFWILILCVKKIINIQLVLERMQKQFVQHLHGISYMFCQILELRHYETLVHIEYLRSDVVFCINILLHVLSVECAKVIEINSDILYIIINQKIFKC